MALQNTDLFYVQRGTDGHKIEYSNLKTEIADSVDLDDYVLKAGDQLTGSLGVEEIEIKNRGLGDGTFDLSKSHFFRWSADSTTLLTGSFPPPQNARENMSGLIKIDNNTIIIGWDNSIKNPPTSLDGSKDYIIPFYIETGGSMVLGSPVEVS